MSTKLSFLLSDLDGVYVDWTTGFTKYMASIGHIAKHANPTVFTMQDIFPQLEKPWLHIRDYQQSEFYAKVKPYDGALEAYKEVKANGIEIIAITSCGLEPETVRMRKEFVAAQGVFSDLFMLDMGASKTDVLKKFSNAAFIDDQEHVALEGVNAGHLSLLKTMPYNIDVKHHKLSRVSDFNEIINHLK